MFRTCSLAHAALASSLLAFSAKAVPFPSREPPLATAGLMQVAEACAAGSIWHPRLHRCVGKPDCGEGSIWHPRLHRCVATRSR